MREWASSKSYVFSLSLPASSYLEDFYYYFDDYPSMDWALRMFSLPLSTPFDMVEMPARGNHAFQLEQPSKTSTTHFSYPRYWPVSFHYRRSFFEKLTIHFDLSMNAILDESEGGFFHSSSSSAWLSTKATTTTAGRRQATSTGLKRPSFFWAKAYFLTVSQSNFVRCLHLI